MRCCHQILRHLLLAPTNTPSCSFSLSRTHTARSCNTAHPAYHFLFAPPHTPSCSLSLSLTHAHKQPAHTNSSWLQRFTSIVTPCHCLLAPTHTPFYSPTHACTPTHTNHDRVTAHTLSQHYIISPSHLHLHPSALSPTYAHTHTQLVVALLRMHHHNPMSLSLRTYTFLLSTHVSTHARTTRGCEAAQPSP